MTKACPQTQGPPARRALGFGPGPRGLGPWCWALGPGFGPWALGPLGLYAEESGLDLSFHCFWFLLRVFCFCAILLMVHMHFLLFNVSLMVVYVPCYCSFVCISLSCAFCSYTCAAYKCLSFNMCTPYIEVKYQVKMCCHMKNFVTLV